MKLLLVTGSILPKSGISPLSNVAGLLFEVAVTEEGLLLLAPLFPPPFFLFVLRACFFFAIVD